MSPRQKAVFKAKLKASAKKRKSIRTSLGSTKKVWAKGKWAKDVKDTLNTASKYYYKNRGGNGSRASQLVGYVSPERKVVKNSRRTKVAGKRKSDKEYFAQLKRWSSVWKVSGTSNKKRSSEDKAYFAQLARGSRMPKKKARVSKLVKGRSLRASAKAKVGNRSKLSGVWKLKWVGLNTGISATERRLAKAKARRKKRV